MVNKGGPSDRSRTNRSPGDPRARARGAHGRRARPAPRSGAGAPVGPEAGAVAPACGAPAAPTVTARSRSRICSGDACSPGSEARPIVLGLAFLFALAISRGWIDETARALLGGAASAGLFALGVWLHERKARTDTALAATAAGIAGLFATVTVAGQVYDLLPLSVTLAAALGVGAAGTCLALRWDSRGIAALGLVGALLAPVLAGASEEGSSVALVFVAFACSTAVVLHKRWGWLSLVAFAVATPQWAYWLLTEPSQASMLLVVACFGGARGHRRRGLRAAPGASRRSGSARRSCSG